MLVSVIIPAFNEDQCIGRTVQAVHQRMPDGVTFEVIVVDNGSTDRTRAVARDAGAVVLPHVEGTIGAVRNEGARHSTGELLIFNDADVVPQFEWTRHITEVIDHLREHPRTVLGPVPDIPPDGSWLERYWFNPRYNKRFSHVGTGHMILTRRLFEALGGFDPTIPTGEDYEFSRRAKRIAGARLVRDERLRVEHHGNPPSLRAFLVREIWHGQGDFASWRTFLRSKVALAAMAFMAFHGLALGSLSAGWVLGAGSAGAGIAAICVGSSIWKYRGAPLHVKVVSAGIFYVYYWGRAIALLYRSNASRTRRLATAKAPGSTSGW